MSHFFAIPTEPSGILRFEGHNYCTHIFSSNMLSKNAHQFRDQIVSSLARCCNIRHSVASMFVQQNPAFRALEPQPAADRVIIGISYSFDFIFKYLDHPITSAFLIDSCRPHSIPTTMSTYHSDCQQEGTRYFSAYFFETMILLAYAVCSAAVINSNQERSVPVRNLDSVRDCTHWNLFPAPRWWIADLRASNVSVI